MNSEFYKHILGKQQGSEAVPSNGSIAGWVEKLICILFPEKSECSFSTLEEIEEQFKKLEKELNHLLDTTKACSKDDNHKKAKQFFEQLPELYRILNTDVEALLEGDPAARNRFEVIRAYPGFYAICFYRIAHALLKMNTPLLPRIITEQAHSKTGIDIHPAAEIDEYFFIDHGTGIVIGETCNIGHHVKLYQGVTLGAL
ncbi:MAG: serine acetyltransferase, partial [Bacteroidetes bacterium]|nr:serine acetyltransferase [Bacteroidota bacterium]